MGAVVGKATRARREAEAAAKAAGKTRAEIKQAGIDARAAADPRFANPGPALPINHGFGPNGGKGGSPTVWKPKAPAATPAAAAAAPAPAPAPQAPTYDPTPLTIGGGSTSNYSMPEQKAPEMPAQMFTPGGMAAGVDGNAGGFRRKKSSARMAGLTSKGPSQFKITGQSRKSTGLNIGT